MSLIRNPPITFLDEPTTGFDPDPDGRSEVWQTVKQLGGHGTLLLLFVHVLGGAIHVGSSQSHLS